MLFRQNQFSRIQDREISHLGYRAHKPETFLEAAPYIHFRPAIFRRSTRPRDLVVLHSDRPLVKRVALVCVLA